MRSYTWILVWATLALWTAACRKDRTAESGLAGYWELRSATEVTIAGAAVHDYSAGNGHLLEFNGSTYGVFADGHESKRGLFTVEALSDAERGESCLTREWRRRFDRRLLFGDSEVGPFRLSGDSLMISSPCVFIDASSLRVYKKISVEMR